MPTRKNKPVREVIQLIHITMKWKELDWKVRGIILILIYCF